MTSFSECGPEDLPNVREFFGRVYRPDYVLATNEALLRWQFGGPGAAGTRYHIKLARVDGSLAGCLGYIPVDVNAAGRTVRGAWTANWVVDGAYRHLALGAQLMRALVADHDVTLVVGASADARQILPRLGFTDFGHLHRHVYVVNPEGAAALTGTRAADWRAPEPAGGMGSDARVERVDRFDRLVGCVWDAAWGGEGAGTRRSVTYLNWRYAMHPTFTYRLFQARARNAAAGFAVYRVEQVQGVPIRVGRLMELVAQNDAMEEALLRGVLSDARTQQVAVVDFFCSSARIGTTLKRFGWLRDDELPEELPMLFQPIARGRRMIPFLGHVRKATMESDIDRWYVTKGDGDQDRPN